MSTANGPCKKEACGIQACLKASNYQEKQCIQEIAALIKCCDEVEGEKPVHCAFGSGYRQLIARQVHESQQ
jgi:hypothetical protein